MWTGQKMYKKIANLILDTLFPISCLFCKTDGFWICDECLGKINLLSFQVCPYCEKNIMPGGRICPYCREKFIGKNQLAPLDSLIVAAKYKDQNISHFIHLFKYRFIFDLCGPLGKILVRSIIQNNLSLPDLIVPVPLHKRRLRWRGFNQSELLANFISQNLAPGFEIPVIADIIFRKKYTVPQMKIKNYSQRKKNLHNVFVLDRDKINSVAGKKILLVDDVATTGSTLIECGRVLKTAGVDKIYACVIARQEWKNVL
jgi:competence protein ComFC